MSSTNGTTIRSKISDDYEKTAGYLIYDISEAVGLVMDTEDASLTTAEAKTDVDNLTGDELTKWVLQRKGIVRKVATYATTTLTVTGTGTVTAGDLFETANGVQFAADATTAITDSGAIAVTAVIAGNTGMVGAGTIVDMPVTISGIVSCTNTSATTGGYDAETDAALRSRYYVALQTPTSSGNKSAYKNWALEVTGVGGAEVFPLAQGDNTVDVVIINSAMQPADSTLVSQVQAHIDPSSSGKGEGTAPIGAHCYVTAATALNINVAVKLTISGVKADIEAAVTKAITAYLANIAFTGSNVSYAQIGNQIIDTDGVTDYESLTVNNGTANIAVADRYVAVIGTVTYTYA